MTNNSCAVTNFYIANRFAPGTNAVKPITIMIVTMINTLSIRPKGFTHQTLGIRLKEAAIHFHSLAVFTKELNPVSRCTAHRNAVSVNKGKMLNIFTVGNKNLYRPAAVHTQTPLGDIKMVRTKIGHSATCKIAIASKVRPTPLFIGIS